MFVHSRATKAHISLKKLEQDKAGHAEREHSENAFIMDEFTGPVKDRKAPQRPADRFRFGGQWIRHQMDPPHTHSQADLFERSGYTDVQF